MKKKRDMPPITFRLDASERADLERFKGNGTINAYIGGIVREALKLEKRRRNESPPLDVEVVHKILGEGIARFLIKSREWVSEAILDIHLYKEAESIFGERILHFAEEKRFIAENFIPLLLKRVLRLLNQGRRVVLVVDSGTTTYWAFRQLERDLIEIAEKEDPIIKNLMIITNNLAGIESYVTFSRLNPFTLKGETSQTKTTISECVECKVLIGRVLPAYAALTGQETEAALADQKDALVKQEKMAWERMAGQIASGQTKEFRQPVFIGLVVGNWIRIHDAGLHHPIPLAREHTLHRHVQFKEQMIRVCDELYVLAPCGKIFVGKTMEDVNRGLEMSGRTNYLGVPIDQTKEKAMKLVSTIRPDGCLLTKHSTKLSGLASEMTDEIRKRFVEEDDIEKVPWMLFPFNYLTGMTQDRQKEIEFPHRNTRTPKFLEEFFSVS